jgi:EAL domain-containing protein (putative c-di-GMP-specific phosphodiesterase class I)/CheY-like chemotaxis protein
LLRILAVDDTPQTLQLVERALAVEGHQVFLASSGEEALAAARDLAFDVALVDYQISPPNGVEVLAFLRRLQPGCVSILSSGAFDVPVVTEAVNRGHVSRVLTKPFDGGTLVRAVTDAVAARRRLGESYIASASADREAEKEALLACMRGGLLALALQPIVEVATRTAIACEALLRSTHAVLKGPLEVLSAAERQDRMSQLGICVLSLAARRVQQLPADQRLFINLHPSQLAEPDLLAETVAPVRAYASRVVFEITERSKMTDVAAWERSAAMLTAAGFLLAVDDLGAGYSSLSLLAHIKPQYMKVDMSIVRGIDRDLHKQRLLELLCQFAAATGAVVIAEGVETESEARAVAATGVSLMQGYLFGRPTL